MKFCPFCGSPAAAWPEYASDYVRGYPLCQFHMHHALKMSVVKKYDEKTKIREDRKKQLNDSLFEAIQSWAASQNPDDKDDDEVLSDVYSKALESVTFSYTPKYGKPVEVYIDDAEVDRWMTVRITDFSFKDNRYRCAAEKPQGGYDRRCTNLTNVEGGFCNQCTKSHIKLRNAIQDKSKINTILEILKND